MATRVPYHLIPGLPIEAQRAIQRDFFELEKKIRTTITGIDAVIDPDYTADTPALGQFRTVFAALTYFAGLGYAAGRQLCFTMKGRSTTSGGTTKAVTEAANIPSTIFPPGGLKIIGAGWQPTWNLAGFSITGTGNVGLVLEDIVVLCSGSNAPFLSMNLLQMTGGGFIGAGTTPIADSNSNIVVGDNMQITNAHPGQSIAAWFTNCFFNWGNVSATVAVQTTLGMYNCHVQGSSSGLGNWNITTSRAILVECEFAATIGASDSIMTTTFNGGVDQQVFICGGGRGGGGASHRTSNWTVTMTGTKGTIVIYGGQFVDVTTAGLTAGDGGTQIVHCAASGQVSLTGPVDMAVASRYLIVAGSRVVGTASVSCSGNGNAIAGVSLTDSHLLVAVGPGGTPAACRALNLDAGCTRNIIGYAGAAGFGLANINLGALNLLYDHTGMPPSGAAGGDLTGSYPNPTLAAIIGAGGPTGDATHVPAITWDAKGRVTAVSSILITGVTPASHAPSHGRGATDPLDLVFRDMTQTFLGTDKGIVTFPTPVASGGPPSGAAGGALRGTYPNPDASGSDMLVTNHWQPPGGVQTFPTTTAAGGAPTGAAGGALRGTYPNPDASGSDLLVSNHGKPAGVVAYPTAVPNTILPHAIGDPKGIAQVGGDVTPFTPVLTAATTSPNLGTTGTATGFYTRRGREIHCWGTFVWGGVGITPGTGNYRIAGPTAADIAFYNTDTPAASGFGHALDTSLAIRKHLFVKIASTGVFFNLFQSIDAAGTTDTAVSGAAPLVLGAVGDILSFDFTYISAT